MKTRKFWGITGCFIVMFGVMSLMSFGGDNLPNDFKEAISQTYTQKIGFTTNEMEIETLKSKTGEFFANHFAKVVDVNGTKYVLLTNINCQGRITGTTASSLKFSINEYQIKFDTSKVGDEEFDGLQNIAIPAKIIPLKYWDKKRFFTVSERGFSIEDKAVEFSKIEFLENLPNNFISLEINYFTEIKSKDRTIFCNTVMAN